MPYDDMSTEYLLEDIEKLNNSKEVDSEVEFFLSSTAFKVEINAHILSKAINAGKLSAVTILSLVGDKTPNTNISCDMMKSFFSNIPDNSFEKLEDLELQHNQLTEDSINVLIQAIEQNTFPNLKTLRLHDNHFSETSLLKMANAIQNNLPLLTEANLGWVQNKEVIIKFAQITGVKFTVNYNDSTSYNLYSDLVKFNKAINNIQSENIDNVVIKELERFFYQDSVEYILNQYPHLKEDARVIKILKENFEYTETDVSSSNNSYVNANNVQEPLTKYDIPQYTTTHLKSDSDVKEEIVKHSIEPKVIIQDIVEENKLSTILNVDMSQQLQQQELFDDQIQEMFKNNELIARSYKLPLVVSIEGYLEYDMDRIHSELQKLKAIRFDGVTYLKEDGNEAQRNNVERAGVRSKSATLLVSDVEMNLFQGAGFLFSANNATIRGYMLEDGGTSFQHSQKENFMRLGYEKKSFVQTLSREEFAQQYAQQYKALGIKLPYNEILANLYSPIGVVADISIADTSSKLEAVALRNYVYKTENINLPIYLMKDGNLTEYNPSIQEIAQFLNTSKWLFIDESKKNLYSINVRKHETIQKDNAIQKFKDNPNEKLLEKFAESVGYAVKITAYDKPIIQEDITLIHSAKSFQEPKTIKSGISKEYYDTAVVNDIVDRLTAEVEKNIESSKQTMLDKPVDNLSSQNLEQIGQCEQSEPLGEVVIY